MIRSELLNALAKDNPGLKAEEVEQVVDVFFEEIRNGNPIIIGYCIFLGVWIWWMVGVYKNWREPPRKKSGTLG